MYMSIFRQSVLALTYVATGSQQTQISEIAMEYDMKPTVVFYWFNCDITCDYESGSIHQNIRNLLAVSITYSFPPFHYNNVRHIGNYYVRLYGNHL